MNTQVASKVAIRKKTKGIDLRKSRSKSVSNGVAVRKITSAKMVKMVENRRKCLMLRSEGWTYHEIAETLHLSQDAVSTMVREGLRMGLDELKESTEEVRELQNMRLDKIVKAHLPFGTEAHNEVIVDNATGQEVVVSKPPKVDSAMMVLKAEERRSKLLALDVPEIKKKEETGIRVYVGVSINDVIGFQPEGTN